MKYFPTLCVDDFYKRPDLVRDYALSLDYDHPLNSDSQYPGLRTMDLNFIDEEFFNKFSKKLLSLLFDLSNNNIEYRIVTNFQKIYPYKFGEEVVDVVQIHKDSPCILAGLIYLNETENNTKSGTSIYDIKNKDDEDLIYHKKYDIIKNIFMYNDGVIPKSFDIEKYYKVKKEYESKFSMSCSFSNKYNRLIMYDSDLYHSANSTISEEEDFRLTQVFFIHEIKTSHSIPPILRKNELDL